MKPMGVKKDFMTGELLVPPKLHSGIFSNVTQIKAVNEELLKKFLESKEEETPENPILIGEIFLVMADYLKIYTQYCANQPKSEEIILQLSLNSHLYLEPLDQLSPRQD